MTNNRSDGNIVNLDVAEGARGTSPVSINSAGVVTGSYEDVNEINHGFVRAADGNVTAFDIPDGANGTGPTSINDSGAITGSARNSNEELRGFVRAPDGTIEEFDIPGDVNGIIPTSINAEGSITGPYLDAKNERHGYCASGSTSGGGAMNTPSLLLLMALTALSRVRRSLHGKIASDPRM